MIHLALRTAVGDLRRSPGTALAVAVLLLVAAVVPGTLRAGALLGLVLAVAVAASAAAGASLQHERRARILAENGAGTGAQALVAAATLLGPGGAAALTAGTITLATGGSGAAGTAGAVALVVPLAVGLAAGWASAPGAAVGRRGTAAVGVLVALTAPLLVVPLVLLAMLVGRQRERLVIGVRAAATVVAVAVVVGVAVLLSRSESFLDLALLLLATALPLTVAVGWLGTAAVGLAATVASRLGPTARLATLPLARRRRQLGPVAAVVAVMATLAAGEGVVGASFEEREDRRPPAEVVGRAGTRDDQAITVSTGLPPAEERRLVREAVDTAPVQVAMIDRVGGGGTQASPGAVAGRWSQTLDFGATARLPPEVSVAAPSGPSWVGVVAPDALAPLGLADHAPALARGAALILNPATDHADGHVQISGGATGSITLPAVPVSERAGLRLPAVLISEATAEGLGRPRSGARVVVVPEPGASVAAATAVADAVRTSVASGATVRPIVEGLDEMSILGAVLERNEAVAAGGDLVRVPEIARLDAVPLLAGTDEEGRSRTLTFAALALLVAVAGTLLVLGGARAEDAVLLVQGAPDRLRLVAAVVRTTTVAVAGTALGAVVGLGVPALAFRLYNGRARDPRALDIPFVLPSAVVAVLVALPLAAAVLAAVTVVLQGRPTPRLLADASRA